MERSFIKKWRRHRQVARSSRAGPASFLNMYVIRKHMSSRSIIAFERRLFRALAGETRLEILRMLRDEECCVSEIVRRLGYDQPTVSHSLRLLLRYGFVNYRREGKRIIYKISSREVDKIFDLMDRHMKKNRKLLIKFMCD